MAGALNIVDVRPGHELHPDTPLVFVHGAWHGAWCWEDHFLPYFAGHGFHVLAPDLRGHGKSPARTAMRWNRISGYVDDVASVIASLDRPPIVIGHSMGGFVVQHLLRRQVALAGAALLATVPSYGVWRVTLDIARHRPLAFARANLRLSLAPLVEDVDAARDLFLDADTPDAEAHAFAARLGDESWLGFLDMLALALPRGKAAPVPALVIGAGRDALFSPASQHHTASRLGCACRIVPEAPHDLMLGRHWRSTADILLDWIGSIAAPRLASPRHPA